MKKSYSLIGVDGNAFSVMGYVSEAMRECGCSAQEIADYRASAISDDYAHLLSVSQDIIGNLNNGLDYKVYTNGNALFISKTPMEGRYVLEQSFESFESAVKHCEAEEIDMYFDGSVKEDALDYYEYDEDFVESLLI